MSEQEFQGFPADLFTFLSDLKANNEREWFKANQARYEESVREPARAFIRSMGPRLGRVTDAFVADDRKSGGSMMRIHRDVRFSKDKSPYKTNVGIQFRHRAGKDVHAPGLYVHLEPGSVFVGVGTWQPASEALKAIREKIGQEHDELEKILADPTFADHFSLHGSSLKRPPRGWDKTHPAIELLKRKDHIALCELGQEEACAEDFDERVEELFCAGANYCRFLCEAMGVEF